jgi:hypothetical protein
MASCVLWQAKALASVIKLLREFDLDPEEVESLARNISQEYTAAIEQEQKE